MCIKRPIDWLTVIQEMKRYIYIMFRLVERLVDRFMKLLSSNFQITLFILGIKFLWSCQCIYNKNGRIHASNMFQHLKMAQKL